MLYYTGAIEDNGIQDSPSLSLGGYISSTQIPNGELNNIFPRITRNLVIKKKRAVRLIVFKNETGATINNLKISSENGLYSFITMDFIAPGLDACGKQKFEKIKTGENLPYQSSDFQNYTEDVPYLIESLEADKCVGVWLKREFDYESFTDEEKNEAAEMTCDQMAENLDALFESEIAEDKVKIFFKWD